MRAWIWAIPLFPLAGFLINGFFYLLSHRTKGEGDHGHGHGEAAPDAPTAHGDDHGEHAEIPFRALHTVVGTVSVALSCIFAFGAIFDVGVEAIGIDAILDDGDLRGLRGLTEARCFFEAR